MTLLSFTAGLWYLAVAYLLLADGNGILAVLFASCGAGICLGAVRWIRGHGEAARTIRRGCWSVLAITGVLVTAWGASVVVAGAYPLVYAARDNGALMLLAAAAGPAILVLLLTRRLYRRPST
jgi:hypothetical protein